MSFTIASAIADLQLKTRTVGDRISDSDFILAFNDADEYFRSTYKMPTTEREYELLIFNGVREYALPSDFLGLMPLRRPYDLDQTRFQHKTVDEFVFYPNGNATAVKFSRETPFLLVEDTSGTQASLHTCENTNDNGTWTVSGDGSALAQDKQVYTKGSASLRFTITNAGGTTTLVNSTLTAVDLTDYIASGYLFLDLQGPSSNTTALTSVRVRVGSDSANYYQMTATIRHRGDSITSGWGLMGFDFSGKTTTGSPTVTAIDYIQILITHGAVNGTWRLDNIFAALPTFFQLPYYSNANFKTSASAYISRATATTDTVLAPSGTENAYKYKALELVAIQNLQDNNLAGYAKSQLERHERALKAVYPSQETIVGQTWYHRTF